MAKFKLKNPVKGQVVVAGRFVFQDGVLEVPDVAADKVARILTRFYDVEQIQEKPAEQAKPEAPASNQKSSLKVSDTKAEK